MNRLASIRKRMEAATKGPWAWEYGQIVSVKNRSIRIPVVSTMPPGANADLIAHSREDIELLLRVVEGAEKFFRVWGSQAENKANLGFWTVETRRALAALDAEEE